MNTVGNVLHRQPVPAEIDRTWIVKFCEGAQSFMFLKGLKNRKVAVSYMSLAHCCRYSRRHGASPSHARQHALRADGTVGKIAGAAAAEAVAAEVAAAEVAAAEMVAAEVAAVAEAGSYDVLPSADGRRPAVGKDGIEKIAAHAAGTSDPSPLYLT